MKIFIGADHRGFYLKEKVFEYLKKAGYSVEDIGGFEYDPNDDFRNLHAQQFRKFAPMKKMTRGQF